MKSALYLGCFVLAILTCSMIQGQVEGSKKLVEPTMSSSVGLHCGFAGTATDAVERIKQHCWNTDSQALRELLFSMNTAEAYLSALALDQALGAKDDLSKNELDRIDMIMSGELSFFVCNGCLCCSSETALSISDALRTGLKAYLTFKE